MEFFIFIIVFAVYFTPSYIAYKRSHQSGNGITFVNIILGWTLVGWVVCLIWAYSDPDPSSKKLIVKKEH